MDSTTDLSCAVGLSELWFYTSGPCFVCQAQIRNGPAASTTCALLLKWFYTSGLSVRVKLISDCVVEIQAGSCVWVERQFE